MPIALDISRDDDFDKWLEQRCKTVGSSDIAIITGMTKWQTPLGLWAEKTGKVPPQEETPAMRYGKLVENAIQEVFQMMHPEFEVIPNEITYLSDEFNFASATPDSILKHKYRKPGPKQRGLLECKHTAVYKGWEDGGATDYSHVQSMWQMGVMQMSWSHIAAVVGGRINDMKDPYFDFEPELFDNLINVAGGFMEHVQKDIPPVAGANDSKILKELIDVEDATEKQIGPEYLLQLHNYKSVKAKIKKLKQELDLLNDDKKAFENRVMQEIDGAQFAKFTTGERLKITTVKKDGSEYNRFYLK